MLQRLNNPELKSSILIPLKIKDKLLGVLNVSTSKPNSREFSANSLETIDKLAELVETTLVNLTQVSI